MCTGVYVCVSVCSLTVMYVLIGNSGLVDSRSCYVVISMLLLNVLLYGDTYVIIYCSVCVILMLNLCVTVILILVI